VDKSKWTALATCFLLLTSFAACGKISDPVLSNLLCEPPCWKNLQPGETTKEEAVSILENLPEADQATITLRGEPWNIFEDTIYFHFNKSEIQGRANISSGKVVFIQIYGDSNRNLDITFGEAVKKLGEPEFVTNIPVSGGVPLAPTTSYIITAIHPERGFGFDYDTRYLPKSTKTELSPENKLRVVFFFDPDFFDQLLEAGYFSGGNKASDSSKFMRPWDGYGILREKYPPLFIK